MCKIDRIQNFYNWICLAAFYTFCNKFDNNSNKMFTKESIKIFNILVSDIKNCLKQKSKCLVN